MILRIGLAAMLCATVFVGGPLAVNAAAEDKLDLKAEFLRLCDGGVKVVYEQAIVERPERPFYRDSYTVRGLAVAYDVTGKPEYLRACKRWSDRMIEHQNGMIPKGAYYMQYGRRPGQDKGHWYVADCSSIALGVLATAVRCDDPAEKAKYLDSVKAFAKLVADNWVRPSGGVANGYWPTSDKEWWCSTGTFGGAGLLSLQGDGRSGLSEDRSRGNRLAQPAGPSHGGRTGQGISEIRDHADGPDVLS